MFDTIVTDFNFYESYLKIGNIHNDIVKLSKLRELALNLEGLGYTIEMFSNYLKELLKNGYKMLAKECLVFFFMFVEEICQITQSYLLNFYYV